LDRIPGDTKSLARKDAPPSPAGGASPGSKKVPSDDEWDLLTDAALLALSFLPWGKVLSKGRGVILKLVKAGAKAAKPVAAAATAAKTGTKAAKVVKQTKAMKDFDARLKASQAAKGTKGDPIVPGDPDVEEIIRSVHPLLAPSVIAAFNKQPQTKARLKFIDDVLNATKPETWPLKYFAPIRPLLRPVLKAIAYHESQFVPQAKGKGGEVTPWQIIPSNIAYLQKTYKLPALNAKDPKSVAAYLKAYFTSLDSWVPGFFPKNAAGAPVPRLPQLAAHYKALGLTQDPTLSLIATMIGTHYNGAWLKDGFSYWKPRLRRNGWVARIASALVEGYRENA
jgi:hypothetical protein